MVSMHIKPAYKYIFFIFEDALTDVVKNIKKVFL